MLTTLYMDFFQMLNTVNTVVSGRILLKFELIQAFMHVLVSCRNEEDQIKNKDAKSVHNISPVVGLWRFFQTLKGI